MLLVVTGCVSPDTTSTFTNPGSAQSWPVSTTEFLIGEPVPETTVAKAREQATTTSVKPIELDPTCSSDMKGVGAGAISSGGNSYPFRVFVPPELVGARLPLVLNFHALSHDGLHQADLTDYEDIAEDEGFVVVHPSGLSVQAGLGGVDDFSPSWELPRFDTDARDDVRFVVDLITQVTSIACIDTDRIYATGFSNGGLFSSHLVCALADRIAAAFSVAGVSFSDGCAPSQPVALGAVHGTSDAIISYQGAGSVLLNGKSSLSTVEFFRQVIPDEIKFFASTFGCGPPSEEEFGRDTTVVRYAGCDEGVEVVLYVVEGGGHTWPGSPRAEALTPDLGYATEDFDAGELGWEFMSRFSLRG
jgi:polyhydroxybutyrate depolymerase